MANSYVGASNLGQYLGNFAGGIGNSSSSAQSDYLNYWTQMQQASTYHAPAVIPVAAKPEDEIGWLKRRVDEVCWKN